LVTKHDSLQPNCSVVWLSIIPSFALFLVQDGDPGQTVGSVGPAVMVGEMVGIGSLGEIVGTGSLGETVGVAVVGETVGIGSVGASVGLWVGVRVPLSNSAHVPQT